jgi:hypothetical protein
MQAGAGTRQTLPPLPVSSLRPPPEASCPPSPLMPSEVSQLPLALMGSCAFHSSMSGCHTRVCPWSGLSHHLQPAAPSTSSTEHIGQQHAPALPPPRGSPAHMVSTPFHSSGFQTRRGSVQLSCSQTASSRVPEYRSTCGQTGQLCPGHCRPAGATHTPSRTPPQPDRRVPLGTPSPPQHRPASE